MPDAKSPLNKPITTAVIIPARYGSTRFTGKPLARQTGKFLIQHVYEQTQLSQKADAVLVATDDLRIFDAVRGFGGQAVMTSSAHHSGTDRIAEVIKRPEFAGVKIIVNVQGDEPDIDPALIDQLIESLEDRTAAIGTNGTAVNGTAHVAAVSMATVSAPFAHARDVENPNFVKVVTDAHHCALYFSRAVIPYDRDRSVNGAPLGAGSGGIYRKHLGIYAYKREALLTLSSTPMCELERLEKLEQLRALHLGMKILVLQSSHAPHGVDTPEDYAAFVKRYNEEHPHNHVTT